MRCADWCTELKMMLQFPEVRPMSLFSHVKLVEALSDSLSIYIEKAFFLLRVEAKEKQSHSGNKCLGFIHE